MNDGNAKQELDLEDRTPVDAIQLDKETLKDLDPSPQDAANVKGGRVPTQTDSCKMDGCDSGHPTCPQ